MRQNGRTEKLRHEFVRYESPPRPKNVAIATAKQATLPETVQSRYTLSYARYANTFCPETRDYR